MIRASVAIANIRICFLTDHKADRDCLEEILPYHLERDEMSLATESRHDVIIMSAKEKFRFKPDMPQIWTGYINQTIPVCWYNPTDREENVITINGDILVRHFAKRKLTLCYLTDTKSRFFKSRRPMLTNYIFFLLHSILPMHGKYCIHASCASKNGHTFLFLGKSGQGKSTISAILGKAGFEYMGDDLVFISQNENGEVIIDAFLSKIKLLNAKLNTKDSIDIIKNNGFKYAYQSKLGYIIKLMRTYEGKESVLIPSTQAEAFAWLMSSGNNIKIQYNQQHWMDICEQASLLPSFTLMFADKEYFDPGILETFLTK
jgi:hypothetical protein